MSKSFVLSTLAFLTVSSAVSAPHAFAAEPKIIHSVTATAFAGGNQNVPQAASAEKYGGGQLDYTFKRVVDDNDDGKAEMLFTVGLGGSNQSPTAKLLLEHKETYPLYGYTTQIRLLELTPDLARYLELKTGPRFRLGKSTEIRTSMMPVGIIATRPNDSIANYSGGSVGLRQDLGKIVSLYLDVDGALLWTNEKQASGGKPRLEQEGPGGLVSANAGVEIKVGQKTRLTAEMATTHVFSRAKPADTPACTESVSNDFHNLSFALKAEQAF